MTKEEHKQIELLVHDIKRHQSYLDKKNDFLNVMNLSICIDDILEILFWILDKFPDKEVIDEKKNGS